MGQALVSNLSFNKIGHEEGICKDSLDVSLNWTGEKSSSALKGVYVVLDFFKNLGMYSEDSSLSTISAHAKTLKICHSPGAFFKAVNTLRNSTVKWLDSDPEGSKVQMGRDSLDLVNPVCEFTTLLDTKFIAIAADTLNKLKGVNGIVLVFTQGFDALKSIDVLRRPKGECAPGETKPFTRFEYDEKFIKLVYQVFYVALGVMTVLSAFFGVVFAPLTYSIVSMVTVVFGFIEYYHKHILETKELTLRG